MYDAIVTVNTPFHLLKSMQTTGQMTKQTSKKRKNQMTKQMSK